MASDARGRAQRLAAGALFVVSLSPACAGAPRGASTAIQPASSASPAYGDDTAPLLRYRSHRLALSLPLPDGRAWRIDDHSRPELVATHEPTRARIVVSVFRADDLVGRSQCEDLARARGLVPDDAGRALRPVEDQVAITQETFDTRIEVALLPGPAPDRPLGGRVMAFGGFLRKCYVFVYSTEVESAADAAVLSSRLAFVRARVLGGLELEPFGAIPRDPSLGPKLAPDR